MKNKKLLLGLAALVIAAVVLLMIYRTFAPRPVAGEKTITVEITHGDQSTKTIVLRTAAEHLGDALREQEGLVSGEEGPMASISGRWTARRPPMRTGHGGVSPETERNCPPARTAL